MSEPTIWECQQEAYHTIRREWMIDHGNEPTKEELEAEYEYAYENFGDYE